MYKCRKYWLVSSSKSPFHPCIELLWFLSEASTYPRRMKDYQASGCLPVRISQHNTSFCKLADPCLIIRDCRLRVRGQERPRDSWNFRVLIWPLHNVIDGPHPSPSFFFFPNLTSLFFSFSPPSFLRPFALSPLLDITYVNRIISFLFVFFFGF